MSPLLSGQSHEESVGLGMEAELWPQTCALTTFISDLSEVVEDTDIKSMDDPKLVTRRNTKSRR